MKNKLILLLCAAFVLMLCACDSGSAKNSSLDNDVVTVSLAVAPEGSSQKAISIGNPLVDSDIIFQYKAIPHFKLKNGKTPIGATGDVWTNFPSNFNGSSFELTISRGNWTFDVRGIDKNDASIILYKLPAKMSFSSSATSTNTIVFNIEKTPEGFGTACLNILVQTDIDDGRLVVEYKPVGSDDSYEYTFDKPTDIDKYKAFFMENLDLVSGTYIMTFNYKDSEYKADLGPYIVEIVNKKNTVVEGRIATNRPFRFVMSGSTEGVPRMSLSDCIVYFDTTACQNVDLTLSKGTFFIPREGSFTLNPSPFAESQVEVEEQSINKQQQLEVKKAEVQKAEAKKAEAKKVVIEKQLKQKIEVLNEPEKIIEKQPKKELIKDEITKPQDRGITFKYGFICDGTLVRDDQVKWCYNYDTKRWEFSLPASLFSKNIAAAEHTLVIKASVFIDEKLVLEAVSDPVAICLE